jgi:hypothetical protein
LYEKGDHAGKDLEEGTVRREDNDLLADFLEINRICRDTLVI